MDHQQSAAHNFRNNVAQLTVQKHAKITVNWGEYISFYSVTVVPDPERFNICQHPIAQVLLPYSAQHTMYNTSPTFTFGNLNHTLLTLYKVLETPVLYMKIIYNQQKLSYLYHSSLKYFLSNFFWALTNHVWCKTDTCKQIKSKRYNMLQLQINKNVATMDHEDKERNDTLLNR
jgi:hypothetical protein